MKLDRAGSFVWARRMGGPYPYYATGVGVAVDGAGNVYTTGYFEGTADFDPGDGVANLTSAGDHNAFISKLDGAGNFVWIKVLNGSGYSEGWSLAVDAAGDVYTAGFFVGPVDFDPGLGVTSLTPAGSEDVYISKLDSGGNYVWARRIGGPAYDRTFDLEVDTAGNVYTAGLFAETVDFDPGDETSNLTTAGDHDIFVLKLAGKPGGLQPVISSGGVVVANLLPAVNAVSPLSIISVFGENFSTETILHPNLTSSGEIAATLGGACLMMNGEALPFLPLRPARSTLRYRRTRPTVRRALRSWPTAALPQPSQAHPCR